MTIRNTLADLFGNSPIKPLQKHMKVSASAADELSPFFDAVFAADWTEAEATYNRIREIEHEADDLKKDLRLHLPKSLFLPVSRSDLLELLSKQDKIANTSKDISGLMLGRQMSIPEPLQGLTKEFVETSVANVHQAVKAISELDELLETGFSGPELDIVERIVADLDLLERKADEHEVTMRAALYKIEADLPPVDVMFLYRIIEWIGDIADRSQKVGSHLLLLLAR